MATSSLRVIEVIYILPSSLRTNFNFSPRVLLDIFHVSMWKSSKQPLISVFVSTVFVEGELGNFSFSQCPRACCHVLSLVFQEATPYQIRFQSIVHWICRVKIFFNWYTIMYWCTFLLQNSCSPETSHTFLEQIMCEACSDKQCDWHDSCIDKSKTY